MNRVSLGATCAAFLLAIMGMAMINVANAKSPNVVVSIKPLHSLVAGVMTGVAKPTVLIKGGASPHATSLRPSDARLLQNANIVFWTGDALETFLVKPLKSLSRKAKVIALSKVPGITLRPIREKNLWQTNDHKNHDDHKKNDHDDHEDHKNHDDKGHEVHRHHVHQDLHIWLSHHNALAIVRAVAKNLSEYDPANKVQYQHNAKHMTARLAKLHLDLTEILIPVRNVPYVVFHDAYQYFEADYGLKPIGALSTHEARAPGAKHLAAMRKKVFAHKPRCVIAEPQFKPVLINTLIDGTATKAGTLDPIGARLTPGAGLYEKLMRNLARDITACFASTI